MKHFFLQLQEQQLQLQEGPRTAQPEGLRVTGTEELQPQLDEALVWAFGEQGTLADIVWQVARALSVVLLCFLGFAPRSHLERFALAAERNSLLNFLTVVTFLVLPLQIITGIYERVGH